MKVYLNRINFSQSIFFLLLSVFVGLVGGDFVQGSTPVSNPLQNFLFNTTTEWQQPSLAAGFDPTEPYTPVAHVGNSTYFVWIDSAYRPWVTQITNGVATTAPVDAGSDYTVQPDGHHRFSLGVDKNGYIHVTGDMHQYSHYTTAVINPYPARYQNQTLMYWRSNQPNNVTGGFTFEGGYDQTKKAPVSSAIPGEGWMLGRFFTDNNGELYYSSMVHAYESPSTSNHGQMAVGLFHYNANTQTWTALGGIANLPTDPYLSDVETVLYWENSGSGGGWFQNYEPRFTFDSQNRLHFAVSGNTNSTYSGADRVFYAVSSDGGLTWSKASGAKIPGLPLRGIDGNANEADLVADSGSASYFPPAVGLAVSKDGKVAVSAPGGNSTPTWYAWNGTAWTTSTQLNSPTLWPNANYAYRTPTNDLILLSEWGPLQRTSTLEEAPYYSYGYEILGGINTPDETTLRNTGVFYAVSSPGTGKAPAIVKTSYAVGALPTGWSDQDLTTRSNSYLASAAFSNGTFTLYDFDTGWGTTDDLHFTGLPLNCDGTLIARVTQTEDYNNVSGTAGIMMRETLDPGSRMVAMTGNLGSGSFSFTDRATASSWPGATSVTAAKSPTYLKLQRQNNVFTGSISPDGKTWEQVAQSTLALSSSLTVGLFSAGGQNGYYMQTATFDNVSVSSPCTNYPTPNPSPSPTPPTPTPSPSPSPSPAPAGLTSTQYTEVYNDVSNGWVVDHGPYNLEAGQTLTVVVTPGSGVKDALTSEVWDSTKSVRLCTVANHGTNTCTYQATAPISVYGRSYSGVTGDHFTATITSSGLNRESTPIPLPNPATPTWASTSYTETYSDVSNGWVVDQGPYNLEPGQTFTVVVTPGSGVKDALTSEVWDSTKTVRLCTVANHGTNTCTYKATAPISVYGRSYSGVTGDPFTATMTISE